MAGFVGKMRHWSERNACFSDSKVSLKGSIWKMLSKFKKKLWWQTLIYSNLLGPFSIGKKEHLALNYVKSSYWEGCSSRPAGNTWSQMHKLTSMQQSSNSEMEPSENSPNAEEMLASMELILTPHKSLSSAHPHHREWYSESMMQQNILMPIQSLRMSPENLVTLENKPCLHSYFHSWWK